MTTTASIRINGLPYLVPSDELRGTTRGVIRACGACEPAAWGGACCTLAPHDPDVLHIARTARTGRLVAMWAGYLAEPAERERVLAADLPERVGA